MPDTTHDPYTIRGGETIEPPKNLWGRMKYLGPSVIVSGSIVGAGELILTSSLGAAVGFTLLWWMLVGCWSKSLVQAAVARYTVTSGDTYIRAINRVPGKIWKVSWPIWIALIGIIPGIFGMGGAIGVAGQAVSLLAPAIDSQWAAACIALFAIVVLISGSYRRLERVMLLLVTSFSAATLICAIAMQFTEFKIAPAEVFSGFTFDFPLDIQIVALALAAYDRDGRPYTTFITTGMADPELRGLPYFRDPFDTDRLLNTRA